ncbi:MAG: BrnT family toxin [Cyanobacteria bacterium J06626_6]
MAFEFDKNKSLSNKQKHGVDFVEAQILWEDEGLLEIPANSEDEEQYIVISQISSKVWAVVITYRNSNVRIISVRRARKNEVELYESSRF